MATKAIGYETQIQNMRDILDRAKPGMRGLKIDTQSLYNILDEIEHTIPDEITQARNIATDRAAILRNAGERAQQMQDDAEAFAQRTTDEATARANEIVNDAQKQADEMVQQHEITKAAKLEADRLIAEAKSASEQIINAANTQAAELITRTKAWDEAVRANTRQYVGEQMNGVRNYLTGVSKVFGQSFDGVIRTVNMSVRENADMITRMQNHAMMDKNPAPPTTEDLSEQ